jgi:NADPH:quinone reductase-like Zn-dependent oxidoreductase
MNWSREQALFRIDSNSGLTFFFSYGGAYAEYIAVNAHMLLHKPSHLSWEEAAGVPEVSALLPSILTLNMRAHKDRLG